jgi:hypothetical protein
VEDENDAVAWMPILLQFDEITRTGVALLILAHASKAEHGGYRGSSAIGGFVDAILEMKNPSEGDTLRKYNGRGRLGFGKPFTVQMLKDGRFTLFSGAPADQRERKIVETMRAQPGLTKRKLATAAGVAYNDMATYLDKLLSGPQPEIKFTGDFVKKGKKTNDERLWFAISAQEDFNPEEPK